MNNNKHCKHHGFTTFIKDKGKYLRCRQCRTNAVTKRRRKIKLMAITYLGNRCKDCGLVDTCPDIYDFHHEKGKDFGIAEKGYTRSWETVKQELDKCILLCANCHRRRHSKQTESTI